MLSVQDLHVYYGAIHALKGVSLTVGDGELVSLIGANGAGKTTTLHTISGLLRAASGSVVLDGADLQKTPPNEIIRLGLSHVPEGRHVFARMTVEENLRMGAYTIRDPKQIAGNLEKVYTHFPRLKERRRQLAGTLSGGEQQMLAIARALIAQPRVLLLDEPSLGLAPLMVRAIFETVRKVNESGVTILIVEQNARAALRLASRGYVLELGRIVMEDSAANLLANPSVQQAYLGA